MTDQEQTNETPIPTENEKEGTRAPAADWEHTDLAQVKPTWRTLRTISVTDMVPNTLRKDRDGNWRDPADVTRDLFAIVMMGRDLGLGWTEAINNIDIIDGRPSMSGQLITARILERGYRIEVVEGTDKVCTLRGVRWDANGKPMEMTVTFTYEMAQRARLTKKFNWQAYPEVMLYWRAASMLGRMFFADALLGPAHLPYELDPDRELTDDDLAAVPDDVWPPKDSHQDVVEAEIVAEGEAGEAQPSDVAPPPQPDNVVDMPQTRGQKLRYTLEAADPQHVIDTLAGTLERTPQSYRNREYLDDAIRLMAYSAEILGYVELDPEVVFPEGIDNDWLHYMLKTKVGVWHLSAVGKRTAAESFYTILKANVEAGIDRSME